MDTNSGISVTYRRSRCVGCPTGILRVLLPSFVSFHRRGFIAQIISFFSLSEMTIGWWEESLSIYVNFDQPNMVCYYATLRFCNSSLGVTPPGPKPCRCSRLVFFKSTYKSVSNENISILHNL